MNANFNGWLNLSGMPINGQYNTHYLSDEKKNDGSQEN